MTTEQARRRLDGLPHLERVRFAAGCARQALTLFERAWPQANQVRRDTLRHPLDLLDHLLDGEAIALTPDAWLDAMVTAGVAHMAQTGNPNLDPADGPFPPDPQAAVVAGLAANAVASAARAAGEGETRSADHAFQAYAFTLDAGTAADSNVGRLDVELLAGLDEGRDRRESWWPFRR